MLPMPYYTYTLLYICGSVVSIYLICKTSKSEIYDLEYLHVMQYSSPVGTLEQFFFNAHWCFGCGDSSSIAVLAVGIISFVMIADRPNVCGTDIISYNL